MRVVRAVLAAQLCDGVRRQGRGSCGQAFVGTVVWVRLGFRGPLPGVPTGCAAVPGAGDGANVGGAACAVSAGGAPMSWR